MGNKKKVNSKIIIIIACVVAVIVFIVIAICTRNNVISLEYEIDLKDVPTTLTYTENSDVGIRCGSVEIHLGQSIDIAPYSVTDEIESELVTVKQLLAPSKKYELVVVGANDTWYVQEIRTTVPTVETLYGFGIGDTKKSVKQLIKIPNKKKMTFSDKNSEVSLQFLTDMLVVFDAKYTEK